MDGKAPGGEQGPRPSRILVATLAHKKPGDNPHLWYSPETVRAVANALTVDLSVVDPVHRADYQKAGTAFLASLEPLDAKIADMRKKYAGSPVTASEPVFGYMAELLGLKVHNEKFALAVMNNAEPTASEVAAFEDDLKGHKVKVMLYNAQASEPAVQRLVQMAKDNKIPVVGVSETEPADATYQQWMTSSSTPSTKRSPVRLRSHAASVRTDLNSAARPTDKFGRQHRARFCRSVERRCFR